MRTEYMREFLSLAKNLNFTKTAAELYITQPTLSKHMRLVEEEMGAPLFVREAHSVSLTKEGEAACKHFQRILAEYDDMMREVEMSSTGITGSIKLGLYDFGGAELLDPGIGIFYSRYPGIELISLDLTLHQIIQSLKSGEIDIGFIFDTRHLPRRDFAFKKLGRYEWEVLVADSSPLATLPEVRLDDLRGHPMVLPKIETEYCELQLQLLEEHGFKPSEIVYCDGANLIPSALKGRGGYFICVNNFRSDGLVSIPIADCTMRIPVGMAYRKDNSNPSIPYFLSCF